MKKNFTLLFIAFSFIANAQQVLTLSQDTIYLNHGEYVDYGEYFITNNTTNTIQLDATLKPVCKNAGDNTSSIAVCFGQLCFAPVADEITFGEASGNPVLELEAGATDNTLKFQPVTDGSYGSTWEFEFFDKNNPRDKVTGVFVVGACGVVSTDNLQDEFQFNAFPNPTTDNVNLTFPQLSDDGRLSVYNTLGQIVADCELMKGTDSHQFDMSDLQQGNYFLKINAGNKTSRISRVIKN